MFPSYDWTNPTYPTFKRLHAASQPMSPGGHLPLFCLPLAVPFLAAHGLAADFVSGY